MSHKSDEVTQTVDKIRILDRRLRNFDWRELQELSSYYRELNDTDNEQLKQQIQLEREKIVQEHAIQELAEQCERRQAQFRRTVDETGGACHIQDRDGATQHIADALALEEAQKEDLHRLRQAEKRLLALTRQKLKHEK